MRGQGVGFGFLLIAFAALLFVIATMLLRDQPPGGGEEGGDQGDAISGWIAPDEADDYVGEEAVVCGLMASGTYSPTSNGQPTFLNLGQAYPNQVFTAVIWGENRPKFDQAPESAYADQCICVSGKVDTFGGLPQIEVKEPEQILSCAG